MPYLPDIQVDATGDDPNQKIDSLIKQVNEAFRLISNEDRTDITKDDAGIERLLIGYQQNGFSNGSVGIKLSQEGIPVLDAENDELVFSTDFNNFKIVDSGTATCPATSVSSPGAGNFGNDIEQNIVPHNLGYIPGIIAYIDISGIYFPLPYSLTTNGVTSAGWHTYAVAADSTNLYFYTATLAYGAASSIGAQNVKYYLLRETAN